MRRYFGQRVRVTTERDAAGFTSPAGFVVEGQRHEVRQVVSQWQDFGFHAATRRRSWLERRHRTYYRVLADDGLFYELYVDRTGGRRDWFISRQMTSTDGDSAPTQHPSRPPRADR